MSREQDLPIHLKQQPFTLAEARVAGISRKCLFGKSCRRLASELYCWSGWSEDPWTLLSAWQRLLPDDAVFCGPTAAWLHGVGFQPANPIHIVVRPGSGVRPRRGLTVRRCKLQPDDIVAVRGLSATILPRTLRDLCVRLPAVEALISIDAAVRAGHVSASSIGRYAESMRPQPGASRLRELATIAAPAESPMETRLRWQLLEARLPRPEVQVDLRDPDGQFVGRADLYYPSGRLVIEYDGTNHRNRLVDDNRRQNLLVNAGFRLLRFTAADLDRPEVIVSQVRRALSN